MASETIERLTQQFRTNRTRFNAFCVSLSDEELERPVPDSTYRVKDYATHLATLDPQLVRWFEAVRDGQTEQPSEANDGSPFDVDKFNDRVVAERRDWSLDQIFDEAEANRTGVPRSPPGARRREDRAGRPLQRRQQARPCGHSFQALPLRPRPPRRDPRRRHAQSPPRASKADPELQAWLDDPAVKWYQNAMSGPPKR